MSELRSKIDTMFLFFGNECFDTTEGKDIDLKKSAKEKTDFILKAVYEDLNKTKYYHGWDSGNGIRPTQGPFWALDEWAKEQGINND